MAQNRLVENKNAVVDNPTSIAGFLATPGAQGYLTSVLGNKKEQFVTNLVSVVNQNKALAECTHSSLMSGAIVATTLNLSLNTGFGYAYLVPYNNNKEKTKEAQFQIGWKGYIQLAMRTGQYKKINAVPIYENQFISWNEIYEDLQLNPVSGQGKVVGYVAYFQLINGFEKLLYWEYDKMLDHADTYSTAFNKQGYEDLKQGKIAPNLLWKYSSFWYKNFDEMANKTMLRQLLSKFGILSETIEKALTFDQSVVKDDKPEYVDNQHDLIENDINVQTIESTQGSQPINEPPM